MRPEAKALRSVRTIASWPISSAKTLGRYLRASAAWLSGAGARGAEASAFPLAGRFGAFLVFGVGHDGRNFHAKGFETGGGKAATHLTLGRKVGGWTSNPRNAR